MVFIFSLEQRRNYRRIRTSARWQTLTAILLYTPCFWFSALPESLEIGAVFPNSHQTKKKTDPKKWPEAAHIFTGPDGGSYRQGHSSSDGCQRDITRNNESQNPRTKTDGKRDWGKANHHTGRGGNALAALEAKPTGVIVPEDGG